MDFHNKLSKAKLFRLYKQGRLRILPKCFKSLSKKYTLNQIDLGKIGKVVLYAGGSAMILTLIDILPQIDIPLVWAWAVPLVNTILVILKKFLAGEMVEE